ncbi:DNA ligase 1-like [Dendronephthya gigantea]|uniref:DNA ligase 1-like n=1 Tax=Dendronephthya gigantea TaxID=151771 RepID=UPI00106B23C0|nr:DNA ligase 1-like [Dendronephthya gigantea]
MKWSETHDQMLVRELLELPWNYRRSSPERAEVWLKISASLNALSTPMFRVTQRSVRDRYALLEKKYKKKIREETLASGISPEENEIDLAMDEIVTLFNEADRENEKIAADKKRKIEEENSQAAELRQQSMESFGETRSRVNSNPDQQKELGAGPTKRKRSTGSDMVSYLNCKSEREAELRKKEMEMQQAEAAKEHELREKDMKLREEAMKSSQQQNSFMMNQLLELQRVQQQQFMLLMQQQKEQSTCIISLLDKITPSQK